MEDYSKVKEQLMEQTISKEVTVAAGATGTIEIPIPDNAKAFLKAYGYTYKNNCSYQVDTGYFQMQKRSDQEGSLGTPVIYGNPYPLKPSAKLKLNFFNASTASQDFTARFFILTDKQIETPSEGGVVNIQTTAGSGAVPDLGTLTAAATQTTAYATEAGIFSHVLQNVVTAITTNVIVRSEGSLDGTNWFNLDANETDTTYTANGTYAMAYNGTLKFIRLNFVSEAGGTAAEIAVTYTGE